MWVNHAYILLPYCGTCLSGAQLVLPLMMGQSIKVYFNFMTFTRKSCVARIKIATISCLRCSETVWHQHGYTTKMENITIPNSSHKHWWPELIKPNRFWTDPVLLDPSPSPAHSSRRPSSTISHRDLQSRVGEDVCSCARSLTDMVCSLSISSFCWTCPQGWSLSLPAGKLRPTNMSKDIPPAQILYQTHPSMDHSARK